MEGARQKRVCKGSRESPLPLCGISDAGAVGPAKRPPTAMPVRVTPQLLEAIKSDAPMSIKFRSGGAHVITVGERTFPFAATTEPKDAHCELLALAGNTVRVRAAVSQRLTVLRDPATPSFDDIKQSAKEAKRAKRKASKAPRAASGPRKTSHQNSSGLGRSSVSKRSSKPTSVVDRAVGLLKTGPKTTKYLCRLLKVEGSALPMVLQGIAIRYSGSEEWHLSPHPTERTSSLQAPPLDREADAADLAAIRKIAASPVPGPNPLPHPPQPSASTILTEDEYHERQKDFDSMYTMYKNLDEALASSTNDFVHLHSKFKTSSSASVRNLAKETIEKLYTDRSRRVDDMLALYKVYHEVLVSTKAGIEAFCDQWEAGANQPIT